ncbi:PH domain-containing protein [Chryseobacterium soli]|nr:PH domain-containing protein [Chryseobacterium soli]
MSANCVMCGAVLTSMDTLLGENKLSDDGVICNQCLDRASNINQEVLSNLKKFSLADIKNFIEKQQIQPAIIDEQQEMDDFTSEHNNILKGDFSSDVIKRRRKEIKKELELLNANLSMFTKGEIKKLPYILSADEKILAITDAQYLNTLDAGILVATPGRLISVSKSMFSPAKISEYPNETIASVSFVPHSRSPIIKIHTEDRIVEFECYNAKTDAEMFYDKIKNRYNKEAQKQKVSVTPESSATVIEQLEQLGKLRENGILTGEEFAEQKKKLLGKL